MPQAVEIEGGFESNRGLFLQEDANFGEPSTVLKHRANLPTCLTTFPIRISSERWQGRSTELGTATIDLPD